MNYEFNTYARCLRICLCLTMALWGTSTGVSFAALVDDVDNQTQLDGKVITAPDSSYSINGIYSPLQPIIILAMTDSNTSSVIGRINSGRNECSSVAAEYQADCLAQTFRSAARSVNGRPDYAGAAKELRNADKRISSVVSSNIDKSAPVLRKGAKRLRAVKKSAIATVNKKTKAIIAETETKLIRSAGNSAKRKTHFGRIAKAVGSTKNILRSA